ncbi:hypothetical protein [Paenibacillus sp. KN14-4R]|uniref:hypothetical protein n=1 Tax=Paenibacillus sp. KN14-4R TaxID=3445773 RepID=UPI003FA0D068
MQVNFKTSRVVRTLALTLAVTAISMGAVQQMAYAENAAPSQVHSDSHNGHREWHHPFLDDAAQALGMQQDAVREQLQAGKSLSDIAIEKGISAEKLKSSILDKQSSRIDASVKSGSLSADKAKEFKSKMSARIDKMIQHKGMWHNHHHAARLFPSTEKLSKKLGITQDDIRQKMKNGQSLAEIAQERGMNKTQLIQFIQEDLTPEIEKMIDRKPTKQP